MNIVGITGHLAADPFSGTTNDKPFCKFTIGVQSYYGGGKKVDFVPVLAFDELAKNAVKYLGKGSKVNVSGNITTGTYEKNGMKIATFAVRADKIDFLSPPKGNEGNKTFVREPENTRKTVDELQEVNSILDDDMPF